LKPVVLVRHQFGLQGIPRPRAGASLKRATIRKSSGDYCLYPPPAGGGLIEAAKSIKDSIETIKVSPARGRGPH